VGGILFDAVCLALGYAATFLAFWAWYEGSLEQFWFFRLVLSTPLAGVTGDGATPTSASIRCSSC